MSYDGSLLRLDTRGRRTGKVHSVLLRYVTYDGKVIVFPDNSSIQDWVLNLDAESSVTVHAGGSAMEGLATKKSVAGYDDPILKAFNRKYGDKVVRDTYWGAKTYFEIRPTNAREEDFISLTYADLEAAFDGVAEDYDRHIFGNPMNVWLRDRSVSLLTETFRPGDTILEVGCGTGTETLSLARRGIRVIAVDISSKMLGVLQRHAAEQGLSDMVTSVHSRPDVLAGSLKQAGVSTVDGAYSTYGAVNTDPNLRAFFDMLYTVVAPGGRIVLGVWNRYCLYEMAGYLFKLNPRMAFARLRNPVPIGKSRFCVASNAFTVGELDRLLSPNFTLQEARGVGILLPPSNLTKYLPRPTLLRLAKRCDVALESSFPWNRLGDHFLAVYQRDRGQ